MNGEEKLQILRKLMEERGYDAYVIPHGDQHDNEYIAEADERIKYISNFSGSNGVGLVTKKVALMWTDGRYFIQCKKELYPGWEMMKIDYNVESCAQYINSHLKKKSKVGMDFNLFTCNDCLDYITTCPDCQFIFDEHNIIDDIWGTEKKKYKEDKVLILPEQFSGKSVFEKYKEVNLALTETLKEKIGKINGKKKIRLLVSRLDDIAWLLNMRGNDIPYNPVFFSFALFYTINNGKDMYVELFSNKKKFDSPELQKHLKDNNIILYDYNDIYKHLKEDEEVLTCFDTDSTNYRITQIIKQSKDFIELPKDLIEHIKGIKNDVELQGYRSSNLRDCVALTHFFAWLENELVNKKRTDLNEYEIGLKSAEFRKQQQYFMGESFAPICAAGPNAAIIHYEQNENLHSLMSLDQLILCDTGGQYMDGTTDITRTAHFSTAKDKEKEMYTRVLLGNLSIEKAVFRKGNYFRNLDILARQYLRNVFADYKHGTTHGVGHFLNVHEGPYNVPLSPGNVITNEPGYYEENAFGIRIENDLIVIDKGNGWLGFENITLFPYERNLIDMRLISPEIKEFIDSYHKKVFETLSPLLGEDKIALDYLKRKTEPL